MHLVSLANIIPDQLTNCSYGSDWLGSTVATNDLPMNDSYQQWSKATSSRELLKSKVLLIACNRYCFQIMSMDGGGGGITV